MKSDLLLKLFNVSNSKVSKDAKKISPGGGLKKINSKAISYTERHRGTWFRPEYDLTEIQIAQDTDSYLFKSIQKKKNRFLIAGWDIVGQDQKIVSYIKRRIKEIEYVSKKPFEILLTETFIDMSRYSNSMWVKVRSKYSSTGKTRPGPNGSELEPVAGYFILPFETLLFKTKRNGDIKKIQQKHPSGDYREFFPSDVIHFYDNKKPGFAMGTPELVPVLDDIALLRRLEENVESLIESNLYPLFHYKIGSDAYPERYSPDGVKESDIVRSTIEYMPAGGVYISDHRHKIDAIGSEGRALRIEGYLDYFKKRVFAGLGISSVDMGEGDTANRSTANTLSKSAIQDVEAIQRTLKIFIEFFVFDELLLEGGFDPIAEENRVEIKFGVIDKEERAKTENQTIQLWLNNLITETEARKKLGMSPEVDIEKTYFEIYQRVLAEMQKNGFSDSRPGSGGLPQNISMPENQYGARLAPKMNSDKIIKEIKHKSMILRNKYQNSFQNTDTLEKQLLTFEKDATLKIKNILKKLDDDLQGGISSNMMIDNIAEAIESSYNVAIGKLDNIKVTKC